MQLARDETAPYDNNLSRFGRGSVLMLEDGPGMLDGPLMNDGIACRNSALVLVPTRAW